MPDQGYEPSAAMRERIVGFLAAHDAPCSVCGYNLRGLDDLKCPECGQRPSIMGLDDFDDWVQRVRVVGYLREHDLVCTGCGANLRGTASPVCGACGTLNAIPGTTARDSMTWMERRLGTALVLGVIGGGVLALAIGAWLILRN
ncbi:MAG: hypothetical protein AB7G11_02950 [Phycisphaerales bacterium]